MFCIANRHARKFRKNPKLLDHLEKALGKSTDLFKSDSLKSTHQFLKLIKEKEASKLLVCGGDGTLHHTINSLINIWQDQPLPKLMIVPAGTMNVAFKSLWPKKKKNAVFKDLLNERGITATRQLILLRINSTYGFIGAIGGFSKFIEQYARKPDPNPLRAIRMITMQTAQNIMNTRHQETMFSHFLASVVVDGVPLKSEKYRTVSAACISHIGFGFHFFPDAQQNLEQLGAFILSGSSLGMVKKIVPLFMGKKSNGRDFLQIPFRTMHVDTLKPLRLMMDGELLETSNHFEFTIGPTLEFIT
ncbi:MAG: hypothetical protein KDD48_02950 [Bdellovibrionales bacterium]|nr:hypothetical protein [Bdellovibrionales bacterium]